MCRAQAGVKRAFDVLLAALALVVLSPLLAVIALIVKLDSPGPAFYNSRRLGLHGEQFTLYKFRTMYDKSPPRYLPDGSMVVEKHDTRVTRAGRFLRLGFDELPQLWNVLRGEMSLIGPRPDLPHALDLYQGEERLRLTMRPGLTGLAQVSGRVKIPWRERLALDIKYVRNYSLRLDLKIALLTLIEFVSPN